MATVTKRKGQKNKPYSTPFSRIKRSISAEMVAKDVIDKTVKGEKVVMGQIMKAHGYSEITARVPDKVINTFSYQATIAPYIEKLSYLRDKTIAALNNKDLDEAKIFDLTVLMKNTNHDLQLLQGKSTENVATKTQVVVYGSEDFLAQQMERVNGGSTRP